MGLVKRKRKRYCASMTKPKKPQRCTEVLYLRCTPHEKRLLSEIAKSLAMSEAAVVRTLIAQYGDTRQRGEVKS